MAAKALFWFLLTGKILFTLKQATIIVPAYNREVEKSEELKKRALEATRDNPQVYKLIEEINTNPAPGTIRNIKLFFKGLWHCHIKPKPVNLILTLIVAALILAFIAYEVALHFNIVKSFIILSLAALILIIIVNNVSYLQNKRVALTNYFTHLGMRIARFVKVTIVEENGRAQSANAGQDEVDGNTKEA